MVYKKQFILLSIITLVLLSGCKLKSEANQRIHNIRITSTLNEYQLPVSGVNYILKKYKDSNFTELEDEFKFYPTILKYVMIYTDNSKETTLYKGITPNVYRATKGFYEIEQLYNDNFLNNPKIRFEIDEDGNHKSITEDKDVSQCSGYDVQAKIFTDKGKEITHLETDTYYYDFMLSSKYNVMIKNLSSDYSDILKPPEGFNYEDNKSSYIIYYYNDIDRAWIPLKDEKNEQKVFKVEFGKYGGGKRLDEDNNEIDYYYKFNDIIPLASNLIYKAEQIILPEGYNKTIDNIPSPGFVFTFQTDENCQIISSTMDSKTYRYYGSKYREIYGTKINEMFIEEAQYSSEISSNKLTSEKKYHVFNTINIKEKFYMQK